MENLKHECGIAIVRLRKPLQYYKEKYGTEFYGLQKMYLLMEKQHNRGQEGAGIGCINFDSVPGTEYIFRERAEGNGAIQEIFANIHNDIENKGVDESIPFLGNVYLGHLRYSTTGRSGIKHVHPFLRRNNWRARNLMLCGNFNLTNVDDVLSNMVMHGQHPRLNADTFILLEQIGAALDNESQSLYDKLHAEGWNGLAIANEISHRIDLRNVLRKVAPTWDGGFVICGATGSGDAFALRDKHGIRPAFYYFDEEICVIASERPVIQTVMNIKDAESVVELPPGSMILVRSDGSVVVEDILGEAENKRCSFERIYFSRGGDKDIYHERKQLGIQLTKQILKSIDYDIDNTVFSFIPNTAELAFIGMMEGVEQYQNMVKTQKIALLNSTSPNFINDISDILSHKIRDEKIAFKDIKLRTFISEGTSRNDLAAHVYDVTYGVVRQDADNIVVIDDSIVRGTTLKQSIIKMLARLGPKKIIVVSSSPQVRFPDYYGIDMSRLNEFCAFRAAIELLKERRDDDIINNVYEQCKLIAFKSLDELHGYDNPVKEVYCHFTDEELSAKIAEMLTPDDVNIPVELVYQTIEGLHKAIPDNPGDWYFSGNYPTPGGLRMCARAFVNFFEGNLLKR
ncbi:MAG: amidophosphoribosyltransferase [Muribaculaceae bacterium]|nr:amidophosphoribosyltransferase [Muribaculaceae bacterium]